jgi:hypothetical protein
MVYGKGGCGAVAAVVVATTVVGTLLLTVASEVLVPVDGVDEAVCVDELPQPVNPSIKPSPTTASIDRRQPPGRCQARSNWAGSRRFTG